MQKLFVFVLTTSLTACSLAPETMLPTGRVPDQWREAPATESEHTAQWSDFGSAELNRLITTALANNTDLAAAIARVEQARAQAKIAGANLYPQVNASGSFAENYNRYDDRRDHNQVIQAGIDIAYEVDLFQRNRNASNAALWNLRATAFDYQAVSILIASEVARLYTGVLAFDARAAIAIKNLKTAEDVLRVTQLRHREGAVSGLELAQQKTSVATTQAAIAALTNSRALFFNQLALVVGMAPAQLSLEGDARLDHLQIHKVPLATPWDLLARRPDIAAAEARLRAADLDIGVARANALPSLSLGLNAGVVGNPSGTLTGLAASFFAPIFQGGALEGAIEQSTALRDARVADYQSVLLVAFREVEDALSNLQTAKERRDSLAIGAQEARKANDIARLRFDNGAIDYTTLLQTQAAQLQAEDSYISAVQDHYAASVDLIRALGGGF